MIKVPISHALLCMMLCGCGMVNRVTNLGSKPKLTRLVVHEKVYSGYRNPVVRMSGSFMRFDGRVPFSSFESYHNGDILKVNIRFSDSAVLKNKSTRGRDSKHGLSIPKLFGIKDKIFTQASQGKKPDNMLELKGNMQNTGTGSVNRSEVVSASVAALVKKVLPNGYLVIYGTQEVRVNYEKRQIFITGIVDPRDITNDRQIDSNKIAELRIDYGGNGQISDVQQPRYGDQILDIVSPF